MDVKQLLKTTIGKIRMLFAEEEIFYIGGSDVLPPPLEKEQEQKCLVALSDLTTKKKDYSKEDARKMLIEHNLRLVVYLAKKFENTGICVEDLISIGTIGLIKGINTFNPEKKIKLATYASRCIENEILMYLRSKKKAAKEISLYEPIGTDREGNEIKLYDIIETNEEEVAEKIHLKENIQTLYEKVEKELSQRERIILKMRYGLYNGEEYTQREIARQLGISRSYVSRIEKGAVEKLRKSFSCFQKYLYTCNKIANTYFR